MSEPRGLPRVELLRALAVLAEPPAGEHERLADVLGLGAGIDGASYSDVFLFQLYPYASVHLGAEGMMGGQARDRVAGFWRALQLTPPAEPDHLAALLGLYASLSDRATGTRGTGAESLLVRESASALLHEHIASWVFPYLARVEELASGVYGRWAGLLSRTLRGECEVAGPGTNLPTHLSVAPELPDPRTAGGSDFVGALLAPVRTGMTLTRADLARIAGALDLGLRAGERRYALEHLLGQDAPSVLAALAVEAHRRATEHEERVVWLGEAAAFPAKRARRTAALLEALAAEGRAHEASVGVDHGPGSPAEVEPASATEADALASRRS